MKRLTLSFYGVNVLVECEDSSIIQDVKHDFSYFLSSPDRYNLKISLHIQKPDYDSLPPMTSQIATPRNICFRKKNEIFIDYFGKALNVYNHARSTCEIFSEDRSLAREIIYLTILSRVSEFLDKKGLHRIHALGLEYRKHGILILLPAGGGKTTLALSVLLSPQSLIKLISEDSPLVKSDGTLLPFPLRIGIYPEKLPPGIDTRYTRHLKRMEFDSKITVDVEFFADKIYPEPVKPSMILIGERSTGNASRIRRTSKTAILKYCIINSVVGIGIYQGIEFIIQRSFLDLFGHIRIILSRLFNNLHLIRRSRIYIFTLGRNVPKNYRTLVQFLENIYKKEKTP